MAAMAAIMTGSLAAAPLLVVAGLTALAGYLIYTSGAGSKALEWLGNKFNLLKQIALPVFEGIQNAMKAGNFQLAATILWQGLQIAWLKGTADIASSWNTALTGMLDSLDNMLQTFRSKWNNVSGWLADRMLDLTGMFDKSFNVEQAKKMRREDTDRQNKAFGAGAQERAGQRDAATIAAEKARADKIAELEAALAGSLTQAAKEAAEAAKNSGNLANPDDSIDPMKDPEFDAEKFKRDRDELERYRKQADEAYAERNKPSKVESVGVTSGFAAAFLSQGTGNTQEKILTESKKMNEALNKIDSTLQRRPIDSRPVERYA
jgi:hypothetical protein